MNYGGSELVRLILDPSQIHGRLLTVIDGYCRLLTPPTYTVLD